MYRQILVDPEHTPFQRILFRKADGEIGDFELSTVTFGVNCAPFLALRVLRQLAQDVGSQYPLASSVISDCMYVDDVLAGTHTRESAITTIAELREALDSAGFPLRKWTSNSKGVLKDIPKEHRLCEEFLEIEDSSTAKTLGIRWQAHTDEFFFRPSEVLHQESYTKREVLSQISKLFDPAGWLAPFVIRAKTFMQEIWLKELEWDQPLPADLINKWQEYLRSYPALRNIRIPRWLQFQPQMKLQYHGFCDASERAYGAAIYVRVEVANKVTTHLLTAKTRVAPVKSLSVPRLELCGAVLLAELSSALLHQLPAANFETFYWTDSTIVLAWLNKPPCKWTAFVANRVAKVTQVSDSSKWSHVRSEHNPADLASRGVLPQELIDNALWWHGPEWLHLAQEQWPISSASIPDTCVEQRTIKCNLAKSPSTPDFLGRFSDFHRALRVTAYVLRFINGCRDSSTPRPVELSSNELSKAQEQLCILTQRREYAKEYGCLLTKQQILSQVLLET